MKLKHLYAVRKKFKQTKVNILHVPVWKINYEPEETTHFCCGIPVWHQLTRVNKPLNLNLNTQNFTEHTLDDTLLLKHLKELGPFTFVLNSGNMGDILIAAGSLSFFEKHNLPYTLYKEGDPNPKTIVFNGSGVWHTSYANGHKNILALFKNAERIVILPSSFNECPQLINALDERFTVFCRERQSYDYLMNAHTKATVLLDHDMALHLTPNILTASTQNSSFIKRMVRNLARDFHVPENGVAHLFRRDCEQIHTFPTHIDLSKYGHIYRSSMKDEIITGTQLMLAAVDKLNAIVTDRLHVGIAGALMGKDVYFMDNSYKKISNVWAHSLQQYPNVHFVQTLPENLTPIPTATDNFDRFKNAFK